VPGKKQDPAWMLYCRAGVQLEKQAKPVEAEKYFKASMESIERQVIYGPNQPPRDAKKAAIALLKAMNFHAREVLKAVPKDQPKDASKMQEYMNGQKVHMQYVQRAYAGIARLDQRLAKHSAQNVTLASNALKKKDAQLAELRKQGAQESQQQPRTSTQEPG